MNWTYVRVVTKRDPNVGTRHTRGRVGKLATSETVSRGISQGIPHIDQSLVPENHENTTLTHTQTSTHDSDITHQSCVMLYHKSYTYESR